MAESYLLSQLAAPSSANSSSNFSNYSSNCLNKLLLAKITIGEYHISYTSPYPSKQPISIYRITSIIIIIRSQGRRRTPLISITLLLPVTTPYTYPYIHIQRRYRNEQPKRLKYTGEERIKASQANTKIKPPLIVKIPGRKAA